MRRTRRIISVARLLLVEHLREPTALLWTAVAPCMMFMIMKQNASFTGLSASSYTHSAAWFYAYISANVAFFGLSFYLIGRRRAVLSVHSSTDGGHHAVPDVTCPQLWRDQPAVFKRLLHHHQTTVRPLLAARIPASHNGFLHKLFTIFLHRPGHCCAADQVQYRRHGIFIPFSCSFLVTWVAHLPTPRTGSARSIRFT